MNLMNLSFLVSIDNIKRESSEYVQPTLLQSIFYGDQDITLGQMIEGLCGNPKYTYASNQNIRIIHGTKQITFFVSKKPCPLAGLDSTIIIWNSCKICLKLTPYATLCDDSWKISFSKFLEMLIYSPPDARFRTQICTHPLNSFTRNFSYLDHQLELEISDIQLFKLQLPRQKIIVCQSSQSKFYAMQIEEIKQRIHQFYNDLNKSLDRMLRLRSHKYHKVASSEKLAILQKFQEYSVKPAHISKILVPLSTNFKNWNEELNRFVDDYMTTIYSKLGFGYFKSSQERSTRIEESLITMPKLSSSPDKSPISNALTNQDDTNLEEFSFDRLFSGEEFSNYQDVEKFIAPALSLLDVDDKSHTPKTLGVDLKDGKPLQAGDSYKRVSIMDNLALIWENQPIDFKLNSPL